MPSITVKPELTYFYTDSGAPTTADYKTLIVFHGHTFHSGAFQRLNPVATSKGWRLICINRREYPGSTPFTEEEIKTLNVGTEEQRAEIIAQQGADYALFVNGVIKECALPKSAGVILTAWSLGNIFLLSLLASITSLPTDVQNSLKSTVKGVILWDPPSQTIGANSPEGAYHPLWDESLSPEARGQVFGVWCASYWKHGDLSTHDFSQLKDREPGTSKTPSTMAMTPEELGAMTDFVPGGKWETAVCEPYYYDILMKQTKKALLDPSTKAAWNNVPVCHMYGDANTWNIVYSAWVFEDWVKETKSKEPLIKFKRVEGANHFCMWDEPEQTFECLQQCLTL